MKCDEQRSPNCARCDRGGYPCEWQDSRLSRSRASEDRISATTTRSTSLATLQSDDEGSLSHRFFNEGIVSNVTSLFIDVAESFIQDSSRASQVSTGVTNFYYQFVYQASHSSKVIRKTLTALCGLYERAFSASRDSSPRNAEYITRYSEAIPDLRQSISELSPDIVLIASILIANCEYLMGDLCAAVRHLRHGAKILIDCNNHNDGRLSAELSETLGIIFEVFDHDPTGLDGTSPQSDYLDTIVEQQFDNLGEANDDLLRIYSHTFALQRVGNKHPRHVSPASHDFQRWSNSWRTRTTALEDSLAQEELMWLQLLHGQQTALNTVLDSMTSTSHYRGYEQSQLDDLVSQVELFLESCSDSVMGGMPGRPFLENVGLILPLFLVALHCADMQTCRAALSLMGRLCVTEGDWNSCCAHAIGEFVINARYAARLRNVQMAQTVQSEPLPAGKITKVTCPPGSKELEVTMTFSSVEGGFAEAELSSALIGGFCTHAGQDFERLCSIIVAGGFQGPVVTEPLVACVCHQS